MYGSEKVNDDQQPHLNPQNDESRPGDKVRINTSPIFKGKLIYSLIVPFYFK